MVRLHALVLGWYENRDHYHKIGYLVAQGERFGDLVTLAAGRTKSEFEAVLDARIRETLNLSPSDVSALSYESDRQKCERVLLLMNVETVRRMGPERVKTLVEEAGLADAYSGEHWWPKAVVNGDEQTQ